MIGSLDKGFWKGKDSYKIAMSRMYLTQTHRLILQREIKYLKSVFDRVEADAKICDVIETRQGRL